MVRQPQRAQPDWSHVGEHAHFVQFYEDESALVSLLSGYVGTALITGHGGLVIGNQSVRDSLAVHLLQQGYDVKIPRVQDRYVAVDGRETLAEILRAGGPDAVRFTRVIGDLIERASAAGSRRMVIFADMVATLWMDGKADAAIRLEELWNELAGKYIFSLCCAYPMNGFSNVRHAAPFLKICSQHAHVFSPEPNQARRASI